MSHANAALTPRHRRPVGRDEHDHPGATLHVDAKKLGNIPDDETTLAATAVLVRAVGWFTARGVAVERILSDTGGACRSHLWRDTCDELGTRHQRTCPYRPQTNGRWSVSTALRLMAGPTPAATRPRPSVAVSWTGGCIAATNTVHTPRAGTGHPSPDRSTSRAGHIAHSEAVGTAGSRPRRAPLATHARTA